MADELRAGSQIFTSATEDTMAASIERHLNDLLTTKLPPDDTPEARDRRRLFAAIARGVTDHIAAHPEALRVIFTAVPSPHAIGEFSAHVQVDVRKEVP